MKRIFLLSLLFCLLGLLQAQPVIEQIALSVGNPIVTRVVITLSETAAWTYEINKNTRVIEVNIKNCDVGSPPVTGLGKNKLVTDLDLVNNPNGGTVILTLSGAFLIETMTLHKPYRIVLDLFVYKKKYSAEEHLMRVEFYEKSGLYNKALRQLSILQREYPDNEDVNYYWGKVLINQKRPENAMAKLSQVPETSKFYQSAQSMLVKLEGKQETKTDSADVQTVLAVEEPPSYPIRVTRNVPSAVGRETAKIRFFSFRTFFGMSWAEFLQTRFMTTLKGMSFWFWLIVFTVVAIIILVIVDIKRSYKMERKQKPSRYAGPEASNSVMESLVMKFLARGWRENEIARELNITLKEVRYYIKKGKNRKSGKL